MTTTPPDLRLKVNLLASPQTSGAKSSRSLCLFCGFAGAGKGICFFTRESNKEKLCGCMPEIYVRQCALGGV